MRKALILAFLMSELFAQVDLELIYSLFTDKNFDKNVYFKGEMRDRLKNNFYSSDKFDEIKVAKLGRSSEFSGIFRVWLTSKNGASLDLYIFAKEDGIYALRSLAQTGIIEATIKGYEVASEAEKAQLRAMDVDIENLRLVLASDNSLLKFGRENEAKFEELFALYQKDEVAANEFVKRLHLSHASYDDGVFELTVGGITDNVVGFMRVENESNLPQMSPSEFIMLERLSLNSKWYLFKTT
ncbi:hypothetical protein [Campylobacter concisus]|uniref:hypothetical protein n=1 Tax=Campylobacter concisus TaxID=199 RepID=UPI00122C5171|nr:hypothetical protein [Campylobacter concisus]